ncbi:MAG: transcriptional regulator [Pseudomonadota bacterium]
MDRKSIDDITARFQALTAVIPLREICTETDYDRAVALLNQLLDAGAADECSRLADLTDTLGSLIAEYESIQNPAQKIAPVTTLRFLMEQHRLTQSDLPEIGSQGVVSEIVREKPFMYLQRFLSD